MKLSLNKIDKKLLHYFWNIRVLLSERFIVFYFILFSLLFYYSYFCSNFFFYFYFFNLFLVFNYLIFPLNCLFEILCMPPVSQCSLE